MLRPVVPAFVGRSHRHLSPLQALLQPFFQAPFKRRCPYLGLSTLGASTALLESEASKSKKSDPLRILFCGSDDFSCASLEALHNEHKQNPGLIESIDVVVRPGKPTGRGYKQIRHPAITSVATQLGLPIHERDTFTGWNMPESINLIVAVSFGLFVPPRLLKAAKYGGLNVHPSLLPEFRGPAPLHQTLLNECKFTGVTLQTLDEKTFDHGTVLAQSDVKRPILVPPKWTVEKLQELVTPHAAGILVVGLRDGLHVPPLQDRGWASGQQKVGSFYRRAYQGLPSPGQKEIEMFGKPERHNFYATHAPKIKSLDRQLILNPKFGFLCPNPVRRTLESGNDDHQYRVEGFYVPKRVENFEVRQRVVGPLWFKAKDKQGNLKRIIIESAQMQENDASLRDMSLSVYEFDLVGEDLEGGTFTYPVTFGIKDNDESAYIVESNCYPMEPKLNILQVQLLKIEGFKARPARQAFAQFETRRVFEAQKIAQHAEVKKTSIELRLQRTDPIKHLKDHLRVFEVERWAQRQLAPGLNPRFSTLGRGPEEPPRPEPSMLEVWEFLEKYINQEQARFEQWLDGRKQEWEGYATLARVVNEGERRRVVWKVDNQQRPHQGTGEDHKAPANPVDSFLNRHGSESPSGLGEHGQQKETVGQEPGKPRTVRVSPDLDSVVPGGEKGYSDSVPWQDNLEEEPKKFHDFRTSLGVESIVEGYARPLGTVQRKLLKRALKEPHEVPTEPDWPQEPEKSVAFPTPEEQELFGQDSIDEFYQVLNSSHFFSRGKGSLGGSAPRVEYTEQDASSGSPSSSDDSGAPGSAIPLAKALTRIRSEQEIRPLGIPLEGRPPRIEQWSLLRDRKKTKRQTSRDETTHNTTE